ncbi:hypothetical protein JCM19232_3658 [Vibrio ishigakensis]|uniref:Uncharacterized protein n=1 Tax=Vibrio ishigakensis TaxID=1481914 RepID=A0A0B8Q5G3_9VIBR|nr:hypothetical protein [Vibrio ishigakensis]GAM58197.1 hypothetical protein JCM19231_4094 [Vibrio ishigakensis]GAM60716.1 hypothetical protein JCM19232_3658 [Vibrio ishigakensis]GAM67058.1 hypothetical protein JCM19236_3388 [Vibrio sp. JCM 19236]GAM74850.1 hypothetical protein JCM19241_1193 [Vibrio ishigakensis]
MTKFTRKIITLIAETRKQWIKELVYGYRISGTDVWEYYGYQSKEELVKDLAR